MTDGIIQKVFEEYINMENNAKNKGFDSVFKTNETLLRALQQELIAEIKKQFPECPHRYSGYCCHNHSTIDKLIGDNQNEKRNI